MGAPVLEGPFTMPMFREFVPRKLQPWIYVLFAFSFQFSGGLYLGALNQMIGDTALMREDLQMCLYSTLAGMAIYFPLLFRMKFRFTNKTLLLAAAAGVMLCNLVAPHIRFLPLLWLVCFIEGMCKIQGTFECMSNIQLWMTPKRDFTVFFPWLHIVILGSMQMSDLLNTYLLYHYNWTFMPLFMSGVMMALMLVVTTCTRHFRIAPKMPLKGIDWLGAILWAALLLEIAYLFDYGDWYDWWNSTTIKDLTAAIVLTLCLCLLRMFTAPQPFYEPKMWTYKYLLPVFILITLVEALLATEHVLEEVLYEEVFRYEETVSVRLDWFALAGVLAGCVSAYWWMHIRRYSYIRLIAVGVAGLAVYLLGCYFSISMDMHISRLYLPVFMRGLAYAILSATFMVCLEEIMTFQHFFQALSVFNMLHMVVGGVVGAAAYGRGLAYYMPDNMARYGAAIDRVTFSRAPFDLGEYMEGFVSQMMEISVKQIYGWATYACILLLLLLLLYDAPVRRRLKPMPYWKNLAKEISQSITRRMRKTR